MKRIRHVRVEVTWVKLFELNLLELLCPGLRE